MEKLDAVILAAGKGTRLSPLTDDKPKALLEIGGVPIIERVIGMLEASEVVDRIIIVIRPEDRIFYDDNTRVTIQFEQTGTATALSLVQDMNLTDNLILCGCDGLFQPYHIQNLVNCHLDNDLMATLSSKMFTKTSQSIITYNDHGQITGIAEKQGVAQSLFLYVLSLRIFAFLPKVQLSSRGEYEVQSAINMMIKNYENPTGIVASVSTDIYYHLSTLQDYYDLNKEFGTPWSPGLGNMLDDFIKMDTPL